MAEGMNVEAAHKLSHAPHDAPGTKQRWEAAIEIVEVLFLAGIAIVTAWGRYHRSQCGAHAGGYLRLDYRGRLAGDRAAVPARPRAVRRDRSGAGAARLRRHLGGHVAGPLAPPLPGGLPFSRVSVRERAVSASCGCIVCRAPGFPELFRRR